MLHGPERRASPIQREVKQVDHHVHLDAQGGTRQEDGETNFRDGRSPCCAWKDQEGTEERHQDSHMLNAQVDKDKVGMHKEGPDACWDEGTEASVWQSEAQKPRVLVAG